MLLSGTQETFIKNYLWGMWERKESKTTDGDRENYRVHFRGRSWVNFGEVKFKMSASFQAET